MKKEIESAAFQLNGQVLDITPWIGEQYVVRFPNNYGASVVRNMASQGGKIGLWELAVCQFPFAHNDAWNFDVEIPVTLRRVGWLKADDVFKLLTEVADLPKRETFTAEES